MSGQHVAKEAPASKIPMRHQNPINVLLQRCRLEPRRPSNKPHYTLRLVTFLAPSVLIFIFGQLVVQRDMALTVAGSLLGVQLAGPYKKAREQFLSFVEASRALGLPLTVWARMRLRAFVFGQSVLHFELSFTGKDGGILVDGQVSSLSRNAIRRLRFRTRRVERSWARHFYTNVSRILLSSEPPGPATYVKRMDSELPWFLRNRVGRSWRRRRSARVLSQVGKLLRRTAMLSPGYDCTPDESARHLAAQLGLPYKT